MLCYKNDDRLKLYDVETEEEKILDIKFENENDTYGINGVYSSYDGEYLLVTQFGEVGVYKDNVLVRSIRISFQVIVDVTMYNNKVLILSDSKELNVWVFYLDAKYDWAERIYSSKADFIFFQNNLEGFVIFKKDGVFYFTGKEERKLPIDYEGIYESCYETKRVGVTRCKNRGIVSILNEEYEEVSQFYTPEIIRNIAFFKDGKLLVSLMNCVSIYDDEDEIWTRDISPVGIYIPLRNDLFLNAIWSPKTNELKVFRIDEDGDLEVEKEITIQGFYSPFCIIPVKKTGSFTKSAKRS